MMTQTHTYKRARPIALIQAILSVSLLTLAPVLAQEPRPDAGFWASNLPIDARRIAVAHIPAPYACSKNWWVSKTGSDANNGSQASPWLTISHAISVLNGQGGAHGDECINVGDGVYKESVNAGSLSGNSDTPNGYFVLRSVNPHGAVIQVPEGAPDYSHGIGFWNAKFVVIDGFTIIGHIVTVGNRNGAGIETSGDSASACHSHHIKVINNVVHDVGGSGIASHYADYWNVEGNVVYNTCNTSTYGVSAINNWHPVALDANPGFHIVVRSNISYNNAEVDINAEHWDGNGITFDDFNGSPKSEPGFHPYAERSLVENNLCFGNGGAGFLTGGAGSSYITIRSNTFVDNYLDPKNTATVRGEISVENSHDVVVVNNICLANPTANPNCRALVDTGRSNINNVWRNNLAFNGSPGQESTLLYGTPSTITAENGNILGFDPLFVSIKTADFRLTSHSPAVAKGTSACGLSATDLAGKPRAGKVDIGAYGYNERRS